MFNDHNIFSNNIQDAANKLRQIQEANVRSASDLNLIGREKGDKAEIDAKFDAILRQGKTPKQANELGNEAHMEERLGYARRAGSRRHDLDKLNAILPHLAQSGAYEDLAAIVRVLGDANAAMGPEGKQAGSKDFRDAEDLNRRFVRGETATPPASLSDLKLAAKIIRNKYQIPWQEEPTEVSESTLNESGFRRAYLEGDSEDVDRELLKQILRQKEVHDEGNERFREIKPALDARDSEAAKLARDEFNLSREREGRHQHNIDLLASRFGQSGLGAQLDRALTVLAARSRAENASRREQAEQERTAARRAAVINDARQRRLDSVSQGILPRGGESLRESNYYKNLSEELKQRVKILENVLNEIRAYTDEERQDEKLADRDIRAARMLRDIAARFNERTQDKNLTDYEQLFAERLKGMLQAKGIKSDVTKNYYDADGKQVYGIKGPITTISPEDIKKYRPDYVKIEADTPMSLLAQDEKDREVGEKNAEFYRKEKFLKLRAQQAKEAAEQKEAARIKKFTI